MTQALCRCWLRSACFSLVLLTVSVLSACKAREGELGDSELRANEGKSQAQTQTTVPVQVQRLALPVSELRQLFARQVLPEDVPELLRNENARTLIMAVEAFVRLYSPMLPKGSLQRTEKLSTEFSDQLSVYSDTVDAIEFAQDSNAGPELIEKLMEISEHQRETFVTYLNASGWMRAASGRGPLDEMLAEARAIKWPSPRDDRAYVVTRLRKLLKDVEKNNYDLNKLDDIHRFRRHIRWVIIQMHMTEGLIRVTDQQAVIKNRNLIQVLGGLRFNDPQIYEDSEKRLLPEATAPEIVPVKRHVEMSKLVINNAIYLIEELGLYKDYGLGEELMAEALFAMKGGKKDKDKKDAQQEAAQIAMRHPSYAALNPTRRQDFVETNARRIIKLFRDKHMIIDEMSDELEDKKNLNVRSAALGGADDPTDDVNVEALRNDAPEDLGRRAVD